MAQPIIPHRAPRQIIAWRRCSARHPGSSTLLRSVRSPGLAVMLDLDSECPRVLARLRRHQSASLDAWPSWPAREALPCQARGVLLLL